MKTQSSYPLERIVYMAYPDRPADVRLRENITQIEAEAEEGDCTMWEADEVHLTTDLAEDEVEKRFDELWVQAEAEAKSVVQRIAELESALDDVTALVLGEE